MRYWSDWPMWPFEKCDPRLSRCLRDWIYQFSASVSCGVLDANGTHTHTHTHTSDCRVAVDRLIIQTELSGRNDCVSGSGWQADRHQRDESKYGRGEVYWIWSTVYWQTEARLAVCALRHVRHTGVNTQAFDIIDRIRQQFGQVRFVQ